MQINFTKQEVETFIKFMKAENDVVRLVNPTTQHVYSNDDKDNPSPICSKLWGHCERCENCVSLRALKSRKRAYKMEIMNNHTYLVLSRYLEIENHPCIVEIVNDVTNAIFMDSDYGDELGKLINNYNHLLVTDSLTEVYNRRFLDEIFLPSLKCCHDYDLILNLAIMDFDDFKMVNDTYGHQAGDALLKDAAGFWMNNFNSRKKNAERLVVRFVGDEMLIIACGISFKTFNKEINDYYNQMRKICYYKENIQIPFSITFGTSSSEEFENDWTWDALLSCADKRMYALKKNKKISK